jgi:hypothetical protein
LPTFRVGFSDAMLQRDRELAKAGHMTRNGKPSAKTAIAKMVAA